MSDTGPGIPPQLLPHIFERFFRGDPSRSGPGAGLGLSIAQELVQAQNGAIKVESQVNKGSTFIVTLPKAEGSGPFDPDPGSRCSADCGPWIWDVWAGTEGKAYAVAQSGDFLVYNGSWDIPVPSTSTPKYAIWGAWYPVLAARLLGPLKFNGKQTGWIYATVPLGCIFMPLVAKNYPGALERSLFLPFIVNDWGP